MNISPSIRPLLREILGDEEQAIDDDLIETVSKVLAEVKYLDSVLGDFDDLTVFRFSNYRLN